MLNTLRKNERLEIYCHGLTADTPMCVNCKHFYQHYNKKFDELFCGHCVYPRLKHRKPYDTCQHFERR